MQISWWISSLSNLKIQMISFIVTLEARNFLVSALWSLGIFLVVPNYCQVSWKWQLTYLVLSKVVTHGWIDCMLITVNLTAVFSLNLSHFSSVNWIKSIIESAIYQFVQSFWVLSSVWKRNLNQERKHRKRSHCSGLINCTMPYQNNVTQSHTKCFLLCY